MSLPQHGRRRLVALLSAVIVTLYLLASLTLPTSNLKEQVLSPKLEVTFSGIKASNKITEEFNLTGAIINQDGVYEEYINPITVALIHSFSPQTEEHFREMMIDPYRDQHRIYANSPAILQVDDGELIVVMRVWLDKEIWKLSKLNPTNTFSDNYFYIQRFDAGLRPLTKGRVLGIPTPIQWSIGDGPIEPRIFAVNNTIYLTFNTGIFAGQTAFDTTFLWDLNNDKALLPFISGGHPMLKHNLEGRFPRDKHWSAIVNHTKLYFTYNIDPLRVIDCHLGNDAQCHFVHKEGPDDWVFIDSRDSLRGGTPFVLYSYPYYVSIGHSTLFRNCTDPNSRCSGKRYYATHIIVMTIEPQFKVLYISDNIPYPEASLKVPLVRYRYIEHSFLFPVGLILENEDSLILGGHVNDHSSVLYRIEGIKRIMSNVIAYNNKHKYKHGPRVGALHNYIKDKVEYQTGFVFRR